MPILQNTRLERFAQDVARGLRPVEAYFALGLVPHSGNVSRMRRHLDVVARLAELQAEHAAAARADPLPVIIALVRIAETLEAKGEPAALKEARQALLDAAALRARMVEAMAPA